MTDTQQQFQVEIESLIQRVLKHPDDPVWISQTLSAADPGVRREVCHQFGTNGMLRKSFEATAMLFDEFIQE